MRRFVGDAYINGIMRSELDDQELQMECFVLPWSANYSHNCFGFRDTALLCYLESTYHEQHNAETRARQPQWMAV